MARALRIEYKNALYHTTCRGNGGQKIFRGDKDRRYFLELLEGTATRYGTILYTYVLMDNHFHLLIETPRANLSEYMQTLNTTYTGYFNRRHNHKGHLYQGRYKAILVEKNPYLLELTRYIHLNPVRAGVVLRPEHYKWSSYRKYIGLEKKTLIKRDWILSQFGQGDKAFLKYKEFVEEGISGKIDNPLKNSIAQTLLGTDRFVKRIRKMVNNLKEDRSVPAKRVFLKRPELNDIVEQASKSYKISKREIRAKKRKGNIARMVAIFLSHKLTGLKNREIGDYFGGIGESAVTEVVRKVGEIKKNDAELAYVVEHLEKLLK